MRDPFEYLRKLTRSTISLETRILKRLKEGNEFDPGKIWDEHAIADIQKLDRLLLDLLAILKKEELPLNRFSIQEILRHLHHLVEDEKSLIRRGERSQIKAIEEFGPVRWILEYKNEIAHLNRELTGIIKELDMQYGQLLRILGKIKENKEIYTEICKLLSERNPTKFKTPREAQRYIESAVSNTDALGVAKLIDYTLGEGTFRILSFLDERQDSARSVYKLLTHNIEGTSFEKQVENGYYLNLLETYGVQWDLEKVARDCLQNFFDANGQTMDGIEIRSGVEVTEDPMARTRKALASISIDAPQDYDWRELIHFGGTTKQDSETSVGGFGEGLKIAAFVLLRDHGAKQVKVTSRDWEVDYYFAPLTSEAYRKAVNGLYAKKRKRNTKPGNYLEIIFEGENAHKKTEAFINAKELFYSSHNKDFQGASFNNKASGGFKVLPPDLKQEYHFQQRQKGHLYLAGQRTHFDNRSEWNTVPDLNIWTWKKVQPKDRDRGMITTDEMKEAVIPLIVESMTLNDLKKSVYDSKDLWDKFQFYEISYVLLEKIVDKLAEAGVILEFEPIFLSNDLPIFCPAWIKQGLIDNGFKICAMFLKKIGMKGAMSQFLDWQSHNKVEATPSEIKKIAILQKISHALDLPDEEIKEVWIFTAEGEKSIFHGQYNPEFYWMAREILQKPLLDALHTYVHEAAHKDGNHGEAKFEYGLQERIKLIHKFTLEHREEWAALEREWKQF